MAIDFPDSPSVNDIITVGGRTWTWDGTSWLLTSTVDNGINLALSSTQPSNATSGDLWYQTSTGYMFIYHDSAWQEVGKTASEKPVISDTDNDTYIHVEETTDNDTIRLYTAGAHRLSVGASAMIPETTEVYDLGSATNRFKDLYLSGTSIDLGGVQITSDGTSLTLPATSVTSAAPGTNGLRNMTLSTSAPTGGSDGDVWMVYS